MSLPLVKVLQDAAQVLMSDLAPQLEAGYAQGNAGMIGMLMGMSVLEMERGVHIRQQEISACQALFMDAAAVLQDAELAARLRASAGLQPLSLLLSELDRLLALLRADLIDLHDSVERSDVRWAREMERRILCLLRDAATSRAVPVPG